VRELMNSGDVSSTPATNLVHDRSDVADPV
jgi:hypothetical protein